MNLGPAYQFYYNDFYGSKHVMLMSLEEEAAYQRLLAYQYDSGFIPSQIRELSKICKNISIKKMSALWNRLSPCFVPNGTPGHLINPRMDEIRRERIEFKENRSRAGIAGNERKRYLKEHSGDKKGTHSDTLSERTAIRKNNAKRTHSDTQTVRSPSPSPSPSQEGEANLINNSSPLHSRSADRGEPKYGLEFQKFWLGSTQRGSKSDAWNVWRKINPSVSLQRAITAAHDRWKLSKQWQDETKQPHICTWLDRRGWEEIVPKESAGPDPGKIERPSQEPHGLHVCAVCDPPHEWACDTPEVCGMQREMACPVIAGKYR